MVNFYDVKLNKTIVHKIGNKSLDEGMELSENIFEGSDDVDLNKVLLNYFVSQFKDAVDYCFHHSSDLELNDIFLLVSELFQSQEKFVKISSDFAAVLYDCSNHPRIKAGELYVSYFSNILYNGTKTDAIGVFKSENQQTFLKIDHGKSKFKINRQVGVNIQKLEKGALIFNVHKEEGYVVQILDSLNSSEAHYWKSDFLKLRAVNDSYNSTKEFLTVAKEFVTSLPQDEGIDKTEQIDLLNRSLDYFKTNESFNKKEFEKTVFKDKSLINSFQEFGNNYKADKDIDLVDDFDISPNAVRKQSRIFKKVLKLDRNFHIYIHGNTDLIEKGTDENGRKYYKIFYNEEN